MKKTCTAFIWLLFLVLTFCILPSQKAHAIARAVVLSDTSITMTVGETKQVELYVGNSLSDAKSWSSSKKSVAAVSRKGVVKAKKKGKTVISCDTGFGYSLKCTVKVVSPVELSGYLNKKYTKLLKKVPDVIYKNSYQDPAGIGNLYIFPDGALFLRYNKTSKKITLLQNDQLTKLTLYGVKVGMTAKKAKKALKARKCSYQSKQKVRSGVYDLYYKKKGHSIRIRIDGGKVDFYQWNR